MSSTTDPDLVTRTQHFLDDLDAEPGGGVPAGLDDGIGLGPDDEYDPDDEDGIVDEYSLDDELTAIVPRAARAAGGEGEESGGAEGFAPTPGYDPEPRSGVDPDDDAESDLGVDPTTTSDRIPMARTTTPAPPRPRRSSNRHPAPTLTRLLPTTTLTLHQPVSADRS